MIKMRLIPLILLAMVWSSSAYAGFCDYEDVPNLLDRIEKVPFPGLPEFIPGLTAEEYEAMGEEYEVGMKEYEENFNYRHLVGMSFNVWAGIDCFRRLDTLESKKEKLEQLGLRPPYDPDDAGDIILGKVVDMAYAGSNVEEIQKMVQKTFREFLNREKQGKRIDW